MKFQDYKHVIPVQLRFSDFDVLRHVNNACYHNFIELGRVTYFRDVLQSTVNWEKQGYVLARTEIDHCESIHMDDEIYCFTQVCKLGNKSMTMKNAIVKKTKTGLIEAASAKGILVARDYVNHTSIPVPDKWRELIRDFEGRII